MQIAKIIAGMIAASVASYAANWFSLHGLDYQVLGIDSEAVKSSLVGILTGFFVGLTPNGVLQDCVDAIKWVRKAKKTLNDAIEEPIQDEGKKE